MDAFSLSTIICAASSKYASLPSSCASASEIDTVVPPDDACILSTFCTISSLYDAVSFCSLINSTTSETSLSETNAPCTRIGFGAPCGWNSISPFPRSFSAPFISRIVRESVPEVTENAIRLGIFALIRPVMTFTDGRWVAITR